MPTIQHVDEYELSLIEPSRSNPRKHFDEASLDELRESVEKHGVLQPILLRVPHGTGKYQIVAGERRFRAAKAAGLRTIPAQVRDLSDQEVLEIQVIENLQREDLHPLEEAEGYEQLLETGGYTVEDLAVKVGKSKGYVYGRMKLLSLPESARKAFVEREITPSIALLIARIPNEKLREKATKEILQKDWRGDMMTHRAAAAHIQEKYMLSLVGAPFDTNDPELDPEAGPCTACPKRTGNQTELFPDVKKGDVCTDPPCFKAKKEASWKAVSEPLKEQGMTVLPASRSEKLFYGNEINCSWNYVKINAKCPHDPKKRTWASLIGKGFDPADIIVAQSGRGPVKIMKTSRAEELVRGAGHKFMEKRQKSERDMSPKEKAIAELEEKAEKVAYLQSLGEIERKLIEGEISHEDALRFAAEYFMNALDIEGLNERRSLYEGNWPGAGVIRKVVAEATFEGVISLILETAITHASDLEVFDRACKVFKVNFKKIRKDAIKRLKTEAAAATDDPPASDASSEQSSQPSSKTASSKRKARKG